MNARPILSRRVILTTSVGVTISSCFASGKSEAHTGIAALDTPAIAVRYPNDIFLVAVTRAGRRIVACGEQGIIIYSDDNGRTWTQASVPVTVLITCVAFVTPTLGWAAGNFGVILNTVDGGQTWQTQLNGLQANQLTLEAAQAAVAHNSDVPGMAFAMRRATAFVQGGPNRPFLTMLAFSTQKVMVFGAYRLTMLTTDGGKTWVDWSLHVYDNLSHDLYDATIVGQQIYVVGEAGLVFRSADDGESFLPVAPTSDATLFGVLGAQDGSVIVFGVAGTCLRSTDGGNSWTVVDLGTQDGMTAGRVLEQGVIVLASENGGLFVSKNHGLTFDAISAPNPRSIFDIEEVADDKFIVVGDTGVDLWSNRILNG